MRYTMQRGAPPAFYELDEYKFQRLSNDLLEADPDVMTSHEYGTRGEDQRGIDLLAVRHTGLSSYDVAQCKCYQAFPPTKIKEASDEFFANWDHWSKYDIKRFILIVACELNSQKQQDTILEERNRFAARGIRYETWDATTIRNKLAPRRDLVERHLRPEWVQIICGTDWVPRVQSAPTNDRTAILQTVGLMGGGSSAIINTLVEEFDKLGTSFSEEQQFKLSAMRTAYREGRKHEVSLWLSSLRDNQAVWKILDARVKAQVLRFAAGVTLDVDNDIQEATRLVNEAHLLDPTGNDRRIRAVIAARTDGLSVALAILSDETDTESTNARASFLLQQGDLAAAQRLLEDVQEQKAADAETMRLLALVYLASHDLEQARLAVQKACEVAPAWVSVRWTAALIDYYSGLISRSVAQPLVAWPQPVDWAFVKRDDHSIARVRHAATVFRDLVADPYPPDDRQNLLTWQLACLANDPDRQSEAAALCDRMLRDHPADYRAITWALSRGFTLDLRPTEHELNRLVAKKQAEVPHVQVLASCYMATNRAKRARQLLERTRQLFQKAEADDVWETWHVQAIALEGKRADIERLVLPEGLPETARATRATVLGQRAARTGDWAEVIAYCDQCYAETHDPAWLYQSCELRAQHRQWQSLAERVSTLLAYVTTADAVRLSALALYNNHQYEHCLHVLEHHRSFFPQERLPPELRQIKIWCQRELGILTSAIAEAQALLQEAPTPGNVLTLIQTYLDVGDLPSVALTARQLIDYPDLPPHSLIKVGRIVALTDPELASTFWRRLVAHPTTLPDELVNQVVNFGFRLGRDDEVGPVMARLHELAQEGRGGVQQMSLRDVLDMMQREQSRDELDEAYRTATGPLHTLAELHNWPLASVYHRMLETNAAAPDPLHQFPLLARHGSRPLALYGNVDARPRLHLDISALLLAAHLDLLTALEQTFSPLRIPQDLIPSIVEMLADLADHQRSQVVVAQDVVRLVDQGVLHVLDVEPPPADPLAAGLDPGWSTVYRQTRQRNGYLVDYLPKRSSQDFETTIDLPDDVAAHVCPLRAVLAGLRQHGLYTEMEYQHACEALGTEGHAALGQVIPAPGAMLVLQGNVPDTFARASLLPDVCRTFDVWIEADEHVRVREMLRVSTERQQLQTWLNVLLERLRQGVLQGDYQIVPFPRDIVERDTSEHHVSTLERCLFTLLLYPTEASDAIWIDDRFVTRHLHRDNVPIVSITDVLHLLRHREAITETVYYAKLLTLRAANVRFIPLNPDEIVHHLQQTTIRERRVVETRALQILRRYLAACISQDDMLQRPQVDEHGTMLPGEITFLMETRRACVEALHQIWRSETDETVRQAWATWVYQNLYLSSQIVRTFVARVTSPDELRPLLSLDLGELLILAAPVLPADHPEAHSDRAFHAWVLDHLVLPHCDVDPLLPRLLGQNLKSLVASLLDDITSNSERNLRLLQAVHVYQALPPIIQAEFESDTVFMARLGYQLTFTVTIDAYTFERAAFLRAVAEAVNGRPASLTTHGNEHLFHIRASAPPAEPEMIFLEEGMDTVFQLTEPELLLLHTSVTEREAVLRRHHTWFERPQDMVSKLIAEIAAIDDDEHRVDTTAQWRKQWYGTFQATLFQQVRTRQAIEYAAFFPSDLGEILWYLRIDPEQREHPSLPDVLDASAQSLIADVGLGSAIERLASLPFPLPDAVHQAIAALSEQEQHALIKRLLRAHGSPLSLVHAIRICAYLQARSPVMLHLTRRLTHKFLSKQQGDDLHDFLAVLQWISFMIGRRSDVRAWPAGRRMLVVWSHAHHIYRVCHNAGVAPGQLRTWFSPADAISPELFVQNEEYRTDNAHPSRVDSTTFILDGLAYALDNAAVPVCTDALRRRITDLAFPHVADQPFPYLLLLDVGSQRPSEIPSFLGGDRSTRLAPLLLDERAAELNPQIYQAQVTTALDQLADTPENEAAWAVLDVVVGDREPVTPIKEQVAMVVRQTDFVALLQRNTPVALLALRVTGQQMPYLPEDVRQHLRDSLVRTAGVLAAQPRHNPSGADDGGEQAIDARRVVLQAAHTMALGSGNPDEVFDQFVDILMQMSMAWPEFAQWCRPIIERLGQALPVEQAHHFLRLILYLRAV